SDPINAIKQLVTGACSIAQPVSCGIVPAAPTPCAGATTTVAIDRTTSSVGCTPGAFLWTTDCPGATFDDPLAPRHNLTLPPAARGAPRAAASPARACSGPTSGAFRVVGGDAGDLCDPRPGADVKLVLTRHIFDMAGSCVLETEEIPVACGDVLQLVRLA